MGTTMLPSVKERTETSGPVKNSSNEDAAAARAEDVVDHHVFDGGFRLFKSLGDDDALAECQPICP